METDPDEAMAKLVTALDKVRALAMVVRDAADVMEDCASDQDQELDTINAARESAGHAIKALYEMLEDMSVDRVLADQLLADHVKE